MDNLNQGIRIFGPITLIRLPNILLTRPTTIRQPRRQTTNQSNSINFNKNETIIDEPIMKVRPRQSQRWTEIQKNLLKSQINQESYIPLTMEISLKEEQIRCYNKILFIEKLIKKIYQNEVYQSIRRPENLIPKRKLSLLKWEYVERRMKIMTELNQRRFIREMRPNHRLTKEQINEKKQDYLHNSQLLKENRILAEEKIALRIGQINGYIEETEQQPMEIDDY
jgi:hypothetical protein